MKDETTTEEDQNNRDPLVVLAEQTIRDRDPIRIFARWLTSVIVTTALVLTLVSVVITKNQRAGCERGVEDRKENMRGWSAARDARLAAYEDAKTISERAFNKQAAEIYQSIIDDMRPRAQINCDSEYPSIIPGL